MQKVISKKHIPPDRDDIILNKGDSVTVGEEFSSNPNWKNWVWCKSKKHQTTGWVPKQILDIKDNSAVVNQSYSSKELSVDVGDTVTQLHHLNGWVWCKDKNNNEGWIPEENFV